MIKRCFLGLLLGGLLVLNLTAMPDRVADDYLDQSLASAATAYLAARGINATISVLQDIDFSIGVVSGSPGQLLDPLNDLIERFSTVMLFATASLGIQKILLEISGWPVLQGVIVLCLVLLVVALLARRTPRGSAGNLFYKVLIFTLAIRFAVPFAAVASGFIDGLFIDKKIISNLVELQKVNESAKQLSGVDQPLKPAGNMVADSLENQLTERSMGFLDRLQRQAETMVSSVSSTLSGLNPKKNLEARIDALEQHLSDAIAGTTHLIALFMVQTVLLPVLFLYALMFFARAVSRYDFSG